MKTTLEEFAQRTDRAIRQRVAGRWLAAAQAEHASIASFNRFSLQLLAVGAPARLVEACQRAALEETHHARLCFGIVSAYAGVPVGPGPLRMTDFADTGFEMADVIRGTIEEGCIGETLAAIEAEAARDGAEHPQLRDVLETIRRDETSHAELAFETVAWALAERPDLRHRARETYAQTMDRHRQSTPSTASFDNAIEDALAPHGLLSEPRRQRLRLATLDDTLAPAGRSLFDE